MLVQIIIMPLIFLSGVFFPINNVSLWLEVLSKINPLTYGVDAIRQLFLNGDTATAGIGIGDGGYALGITVFGHNVTILEDIAIVAVLGVVLMVAAMLAFNKQD